MSAPATTSEAREVHPLRTGPGRLLVLVSLLGSVGYGLYTAGSAVYFVREVGLSPTMVGTGLSVAGFVGLFAGLPIGRVADRLGPKRVAVVAATARTLPLVFALWVTAFWQVLLIVLVLGVAESGWTVAEEATIARLTAGAGRVRISAALRAVFNVGLTVGSLLAGVALAIGTRRAYDSLILAYVATSVLGAVLYTRLPATPGRDIGHGPRLFSGAALRDRPYMSVALVSCLSTLGDTVLSVGLPLWIVSDTAAPRSMAGWLLGINTLLVAALQIRVARAADTMPGAIRSQQVALAGLALCCVLAGLAGHQARWPATALLLAAVGALTVGEMAGQGARWTMRFTLAPAAAQGEYGAAFRLGLLVPRAAGPVLVTALTSGWHLSGWLVLCALFLAGSGLTGPVTRWAVRTRPQETA
ncbi:MAG TPA: MFS transporter [Actinospica sp.]|jgi:MFS family permease|nr:MFS transporter [Actinospica sp.]